VRFWGFDFPLFLLWRLEDETMWSDKVFGRPLVCNESTSMF
jgi:hypothetical protein